MSSTMMIIGGGIAGAYSAFALARAGLAPILVERAGLAAEASGRNPGGLNPLLGAGIPGPLLPFALESFQLHLERWPELRARSRLDFGGRFVSRVHVMLTPEDRAALAPMCALQQATPGFAARWLDARELAALEPRVSDEAVGALRVEGNARVTSDGYTCAIVEAAVSLGARVVTGEVVGIDHHGGRASAVVLGSGERIACDGVVVATGASCEAPARWLGVALPMTRIKGELLWVELDAPLAHTFARGDASVYGVGTRRVCIGGTEAHVASGGSGGVDDIDHTPTDDARRALLAKARRLFPTAIDETRVCAHVAGVRPVSADGFPIVGAAPGWDNVWLALGGGRKGMLYGAGMGEAVAELAVRGATRLSIAPCSPARFAAPHPGGDAR